MSTLLNSVIFVTLLSLGQDLILNLSCIFFTSSKPISHAYYYLFIFFLVTNYNNFSNCQLWTHKLRYTMVTLHVGCHMWDSLPTKCTSFLCIIQQRTLKRTSYQKKKSHIHYTYKPRSRLHGLHCVAALVFVKTVVSYSSRPSKVSRQYTREGDRCVYHAYITHFACDSNWGL